MKKLVIGGLILFGVGIEIISEQSKQNKKLITENGELKEQLSISNMEKDKLYRRLGKLLTINNKNLQEEA